MISKELIKIINNKIVPSIQYEIGESNITKEVLQQLVNELSNDQKILGNIISLTQENRVEIFEYLLKLYNLNESDHIYIKGQGIYNNQNEYLLDKENWFYYAKHKDYLLEHVFSEKPEIVYSLDEETDEIIKRLPNPDKHGEEYAIKGMVIGHIQSGKTANFTHLISKAASIGYKFIIVLSGMTNMLRLQTQTRLNKELIGDQSSDETQSFVKWYPGESKYNPLTTLRREYSSDDGDFKLPTTSLAHNFNNDDVTIAIIKKLAIAQNTRNRQQIFKSILGNLITWIEHDKSLSRDQLPPILIIDDEADQASVDASDKDMDPTTINHAIRKLLSLFPKSVYIGYTATPFANIFISRDDEYNGLPNLYPKDFIYTLPEPAGYFGVRQFFQMSDEDNTIIKLVPDDEKNQINDVQLDTVTDSLRSAILDFIFSVIIRQNRKDYSLKSMMIHTDHRNVTQRLVFVKVNNFLDLLLTLELDGVFNEFQSFVEESKIFAKKLGLIYEYPNITFNDFKQRVILITGNLLRENIKILNSENDAIDFSTFEVNTNLICIGGNLLSRGVTVEGLCISYYLRDTSRYDTLLQMARWFGYRKGYEDLLRVYTTEQIKNNFEYLIHVESDLRDEIERYITEGITPEEFAPKVRAHIKMLPTAKMGAAVETKSYSQHVIQTIYFSNKKKELYLNYCLAKYLVSQSLEKKDVEYLKGGSYLVKGLDLNLFYEFIEKYKYHDKNSFDVNHILAYVKAREDLEISEFDLLISSLKTYKPGSQVETIGGITINPVMRSIRKNKIPTENFGATEINLGVISDTGEVTLAGESNRLVLILYFIDHTRSNAFNNTFERIVDELIDFNPVGYALVFPKTKYKVDEHNYYQQVFS